MLGISIVPPFIILSSLCLLPESPRWLLGKGREREAFSVLCTVSERQVHITERSVACTTSERRTQRQCRAERRARYRCHGTEGCCVPLA